MNSDDLNTEFKFMLFFLVGLSKGETRPSREILKEQEIYGECMH